MSMLHSMSMLHVHVYVHADAGVSFLDADALLWLADGQKD
jgi:hypothetical protein